MVHFGCAAQQRIGERCGRKLQQVVDTDGSNSCGRLVMAAGSHRAGAAVAASGDRPHRRSVLLMAGRPRQLDVGRQLQHPHRRRCQRPLGERGRGDRDGCGEQQQQRRTDAAHWHRNEWHGRKRARDGGPRRVVGRRARLVSAGESTEASGGSVLLSTGWGQASSSGLSSIRTKAAGQDSVVHFGTGTAKVGTSGSLVVRTGSAAKGDGGSVSIAVGCGTTYGGSVLVAGGERARVHRRR